MAEYINYKPKQMHKYERETLTPGSGGHRQIMCAKNSSGKACITDRVNIHVITHRVCDTIYTWNSHLSTGVKVCPDGKLRKQTWTFKKIYEVK